MSILKKSEDFKQNSEDSEWDAEIINNEKTWTQSVMDFFIDLVKTVLISLAIILPIRYFVIQPFYVSGASMEPNFYDSEYLIVDELTYRFKEPVRGDIIIFKNPRNEKEYFIKRILALPGESIEIYNNSIKIYNEEYQNGFVVTETYLSEGENTTGNEVLQLEANEYYVMGDNRDRSLDSRSFGPINKEAIIGKVLLRGWPLDRFTFFQGHEYDT